MLPRFLQLPLTIDCSASKHNRHWKQQMQRDKQHASTTPSTVRVAFPIEIVYLHLPQPTNTIHAATISTTAIDHSFFNQQTMRDTQLQYTVSVVFPIQFARLDHLSVCMLHFPLPLCSIFDTAIDNKIHNCFHISCCISHCHWVTTTAISWQLHTSLHNSPEYFPPPSTTESTSCSIVPSPTSKHSTFHISCCISHCHQPASTTALTTPSSFRVAIPIATRFTFPTAIDYSNYKLFYRPFSNQQTQRDTCLGIYNSFYSSFCICHAICPPPIIQPANTTATGIDNCFHCYDTTTDYMLFTQLTQQLKTASTTRVASPAYLHNSNHKIHTGHSQLLR